MPGQDRQQGRLFRYLSPKARSSAPHPLRSTRQFVECA